MSLNFTDGGDLPLRVSIEELDERIDLAGAGLDAVEDKDEDRPRA